VPELKRPDGVEIHWEQQGDGSLVVLSPFWSHHPSAFENLISDLSGDHRVVRYDARGTGESTRVGPHDIETGATDLAAVIQTAGPPAVVITQADALNVALRVGARHPDLARTVLGVGNVCPIAVRDLAAHADSLIASESVREAGLQFAETDYRAALRAVIPPGNRQMSEDEVRERVEAQAAYCPQETAIPRLRAWWDDDPLEAARAMGDRLWLIYVRAFAAELFPGVSDMQRLSSEMVPEAHVEVVEEGIISRPDLTAEIVRRIAAKDRA
jgi:pimeloyl-ACP methyl ester carboxylesterase